MFDIYSESLLSLGRFLNHLPKDIALIHVYDYYDNEKLWDTKDIVSMLFKNEIDYDFREPDDEGVVYDTVIIFSSTTYASNYFKFYNLCTDKEKEKLNKLTKTLFTFVVCNHNGYYTTEEFTINKKLQNKDVIKVINEIRQVISKEHETYINKLNKNKVLTNKA